MKKQEIETIKQLLSPENSIDELTFAEFPLATLDKRKRMRAMKFTDVITDPTTGRKIQRTWITTGLFEIGLPTMDDLDIYHGLKHFALEQNLDKEDSPINYITYKTYEMLHLVGWPLCGEYYIKHDLALLRLFSVSCIAIGSYYDPELKKLIPYMEGIRLINRFRIYNSLTKDHPQLKGHQWEYPWNFVEFSDIFMKSLRNHWVKKFNLALYFSLKNSISKRLYSFIDKYFNNEKYIEIEGNLVKLEWQLNDLAFVHLGLNKGYYPSQVKRCLEPAINELIKVGYLVTFKYETKLETEYVVFYRYAENITLRNQAEQIVKYFKEQARSSTGISEKEIQTAMKIIEETCYETAKYIVDYAVSEAEKTNFKMQNFQAVLQYKEKALETLENEKTAKAKEIKYWQKIEQERRMIEKEKEEFDRYMKYYISLQPGTQNELTQKAVAQLKEQGVKDEYLNDTIVFMQVVEILKQQGVKL